MVDQVSSIKKQSVDIAYNHFRETGEISMRKVGESAGVTATALYRHYANKQALLDAVADQAFSGFEKRLRSITATEPAGIIRGILDQYQLFAADEPNLFRLMFVEPRPVTRKFPADFAAHRSAVFNLLWKAVDDQMNAGRPAGKDKSLYLAHDIWAMTHGQILLWRAGRFVDEQAFKEVLYRSIDRFVQTL